VTADREFSVARYLVRVIGLGTLLGLVLFLVYLTIAMLSA